MKASDAPYVILGFSILALVTWFAVWQTVRLRRSAHALASDLRHVVESIAGALNMQLDTGVAHGAELSSRLPSMKATVRDHAITVQPKVLDVRAPLALGFSIAIVPRPGRRWTMPSTGTQPVREGLPASEQAYQCAKRDRLISTCPSQQKRIQDLFAPQRQPLRVVGAHVVSRSISVDLQGIGGSRDSMSSTSSADCDDLRRIVDDLVSIAEALPSQPA